MIPLKREGMSRDVWEDREVLERRWSLESEVNRCSSKENEKLWKMKNRKENKGKLWKIKY